MEYMDGGKMQNNSRPHTRQEEREPGMYHLYARHVCGGQIFYRQSDFKKFLYILEEARIKFKSKLVIVVCMSNHFHMIVDSPDIMGFKTYVVRKYCGWYNMRHKRKGPLLYQSTIKASPVFYGQAQRDKILYNANNPVKAKLCKSPFCYRYSSLRVFTKNPGVWRDVINIDKSVILRLFETLDNFRNALSAELEYKKWVKDSKTINPLNHNDYI